MVVCAAAAAGGAPAVAPDPRWLPFIRTDRYGEGGWVMSPAAKLRLGVLAATLLPLRLILALSCIASYYVTVRLVTLIPHELVVRRIVTACGKGWSRACLFCLGFVRVKWVRVGGEPRAAKRRSVAVVSNHMSWVDILIQMARYFPAFVARDGTQHLPMIGLISQRMQCIYVDREKKGTSSNSNSSSRPVTPEGAAAASDALGVAGQVKQRMLLTAQRPELELRPMLLFPEGTTTNGRFLLPFKTGAFLAGVPVLPTIIHYHSGAATGDRSSRGLAAATVASAAALGAGAAGAAGAGGAAALAAAAAAGLAAGLMLSGALSGRGGVSPCWESIDATRHLLLMMCQPFHTVTCYELPLFTPDAQQQADPRAYAAAVRAYMLHHSTAVMGPAALQPSDGLLEDKRAYQAWMRSRRGDIEAGRGLGPGVFALQPQPRPAAGGGGGSGEDSSGSRGSCLAGEPPGGGGGKKQQ